MRACTILSPSEQVAAHLRGELQRGTWSGEMPGTPLLAVELGIDRKTITMALDLLEEEGLLAGQGPGRRRRILPRPGDPRPPALRIAILEYAPPDLLDNDMIELLDKLGASGHHAFSAPKTLTELDQKRSKVRRMVKTVEADAWIVGSGSHPVLAWFSSQPLPAFAFFGRMEGLPIAGTKPDKQPSMVDATRRLIALGHRRIALLVRMERRLPEPGGCERVFLNELETHGIPTGAYNLPDWEENVEGYDRMLTSLFGVTPPTALIIDEAPLFNAAQQFLGNRGLRVPEDVSLICTDGDPTFSWCKRSAAHIRWDYRPVVRRIVHWANNVARGKKDRRQSFTKAVFVEGWTMGQVPKGRGSVSASLLPNQRSSH